MRDRYDIVVVGGGPAGSMAAKYAAEGGASVLLLEKDRDIGNPVRCAEGLSESGLKKYVGFQERWIARIIKGAHLIAPDGTIVEPSIDWFGYVLHRKIFDADLAAMAGDAGADVFTKTYVFGLIHQDGKIAGAKVRHLGVDRNVHATIVIGADGIESRVGRWAGIDTRTLPEEMDACVQMTLSGIDIDPDNVKFYFGKTIAPGGYLWVFPKGPKSANVGLGVSGSFTKDRKPIDYLREFVEKTYPRASVLTTVAGGVPTMPTLKHIVADGLMLVGDAAHQINPLSGGGITNAIIAGQIAGRIAALAIHEGDVTKKRLSEYPKQWDKAEGKNNERAYRIKNVVTKFADEDLNKIADVVNRVPQEKRTLLRIFEAALTRHPKLILEAAKIFR